MNAPTVGKDGKTPGLTPSARRRLLDAPDIQPPAGVRDPALLGVLAYTGCRVGGLTRLRVRDYQVSGGHKVLRILGKERRVPLHPEAFEWLDTWLETARLCESPAAPLIAPSLPDAPILAVGRWPNDHLRASVRRHRSHLGRGTRRALTWLLMHRG